MDDKVKTYVRVKRILRKVYKVAKLILKWVTVLPIAIEYIIKFFEKKGN